MAYRSQPERTTPVLDDPEDDQCIYSPRIPNGHYVEKVGGERLWYSSNVSFEIHPPSGEQTKYRAPDEHVDNTS